MKTHYNVLELDQNCTPEEIKNSYIKLSKKYHPDKNKSKEAEKKIIEINEAYSVLKNRSTRHQYDERLQWQKAEHTMNQARMNQYHQVRPQTYEDYVYFYHRARTNQEFSKPPFASKQFNVVLCCCVLMIFGTGLRIMYAWSEAHHRRVSSHLAAAKYEDMSEDQKQRLKNFREMWKARLEGEDAERNSKS